MTALPLEICVPFGWNQRTVKVGFARQHGFGVEIGVFASGEAVDDPCVRNEYERRLTKKLFGFPGPVSMHGAFMDLAVHSVDSHIACHSRRRILDDIQLALRLGCKKVVFHTGFNPLIPSGNYQEQFLSTHVKFWQRAATYAPGLTICLENQWEPDPGLLKELIQRIGQPNVRLCLDVAHAHAYSSIPVVAWLSQLAPHLAHMHWNDNCGDTDSHLAIGSGTMDWSSLTSATLRLPAPPSIVIELGTLEAIRQSLAFLARLPELRQAKPKPFHPVSKQ